MTIHEEINESILTVKPEGSLNTLTAGDLEAFLLERYDRAWQIVLDFSDVPYISSAGLRVVIQAHKKMRDKGDILIRNACEDVRKVFELTGYIHVVQFE